VTATQLPTSTISPTPARRHGNALGIAKKTANGFSVTIYYLPSMPALQSESGSTDMQSQAQDIPILDGLPNSGDPVAVIGDVEGNGGNALVVGETGPVGQPSRDLIEVYRLSSGQPAERLAQLAAFGNSGISSSGNIAVGSVDSSAPGDEIIVGEDGSRRRASVMRVFGGFAEGNPHLLYQFRALPSQAAGRRPLSFALGHVLWNVDSSVQQVVVGDRLGWVWIWSLDHGQRHLLKRFPAMTGLPGISAQHLAVGDVMPQSPGDEIVVADDGTRQDGLVRVFSSKSAMPLLEFEAFEPGLAPDGVELWVADVIASRPGAELIVGQGAAGGQLRVFSLAQGIPEHILDVPDPRHRTTSLAQHLAVGVLMPDMLGDEIAVAQNDPSFPVEVFHLDESGNTMIADLPPDAQTSAVGNVAIGR
jgi:hypothetical protein